MLPHIEARRIEVAPQFAVDILLALLLNVCRDHLPRIGIGIGAAFTELLGRPKPEHFVAPRLGPEAERFVMRELLLETVLALVERGHSFLPNGSGSRKRPQRPYTDWLLKGSPPPR